MAKAIKEVVLLEKGGGGGLVWKGKGRLFYPPPPLPPPKAYPSSLDQRLGGPHLLWSAHYLLPLEYNSADRRVIVFSYGRRGTSVR